MTIVGEIADALDPRKILVLFTRHLPHLGLCVALRD